jgi:hypothetical protein
VTMPIRISRRLALTGGAASAALLASNTLAQSPPGVPAPDEEMTVLHDDVVFEHEIVGPGFDLGGPKIAPFPPFAAGFAGVRAFGPISIDSLKEELTQTRADRDFAQGKMDLTSVNALLQSAETLIVQAETKQPTPTTSVSQGPKLDVVIRKIGPFAIAREARQAGAQLAAARAQMEAALGGVLPSSAKRVSRELTLAHRVISEVAAAVKGSADASSLATQAQGFYKQAYDGYQTGQYDKAAAHARAGIATAHAARTAVEPEPAKPGAPPPAPPPPTF